MDNLNKIPVLITGGGAPGAAGIIRCARMCNRYTLVVADKRPFTVGRFLADDYFTLPLPSDKGFIDSIADACHKKSINIILPLVTKELPVFAQYKAMLANAGIAVIVSGLDSLNIANNKGLLYDYFRGQVFIPEYKRCTTWMQVKDAIYDLGYPEKPVCFKPCLGNGGRGFRILDEKKDRFDILFNQKPNISYTTFQEIEFILSDRLFPELLISEYLPGMEYSVDAFCVHGEAMVVLPRKRLRMIEGISVEGEFVEEAELMHYTRIISKKIGLHGPIGLQFKADLNGNYKLLEINPRVQGTIAASVGAGINLIELALDYTSRGYLPTPLPTVKWGAKFIRYWNEVFYDN
jgi:carbamoyl-phosphate synthase large subunit